MKMMRTHAPLPKRSLEDTASHEGVFFRSLAICVSIGASAWVAIIAAAIEIF